MANDVEPRTETSLGSDVFISYAREDQAFVRRLTEALAARGKKAWVDWADIPPTAEWMAEIGAAIDATDTYLVVLSPDFAASKVCAAELDTALEANKRIVPVLAREVDEAKLPDAVAKLNWVAFTDGFEPAVAKLVEALDTDLDSVKVHTRLLIRAREWEEASRDRAKLLRGGDLERAESWLAAPGRGAEPTQLQTSYVMASRGAASRRQRTTVVGVSVALVVALLLAGLALVQRREAVSQRAEAIEQRDLARSGDLASAALSQISIDPELSLLLAIEAAEIRHTPRVEQALRESLKASHVVSVYAGHDDEVNDLTFAPDGSWLASSSDDGTIQVWDPVTGDVRTTISFSDDPDARIYALTTDGRKLASAGEGVDLTIWDPVSGDRILAIPLPGQGFVYTLSFTPDGRRLVSAGGGDALIWDAVSGRQLDSIRVPGGAFGASFSPDGELVATTGGDGVIRLWDPGTGRQVGQLEGHQGLAFAVWFSPDGLRLVTAAEDRTARVWDVRSRTQLAVLPHASLVNDVTFVRGRDYVATVDTEGIGRIWSLDTGEPVSELLGHNSWITYVAYDPVGDRVATASVDGTVRLWRPGSGVSQLDVERPELTWGARYSPDGALIALSGGSGQGGQGDRVEVVDAETGLHVAGLALPDEVPEVPDEVGTPWFTPDGSSVAATAIDRRPDAESGIAFGVVQFWDAGTGEPGRRYALPFPALPYAIGFTSDGARFAVPSPDGVTRVWGTASGEVEAEFEGADRGPPDVPGGAAIYVATFDPQDRYVATSDGNVAVLWDPETDEIVQRFEEHGDVVTGLDFSPDGRWLVTASYDQTARIWDVASGEQITVLTGHQNQVVSAEFSPDGRFVVTAARDGTVRIWDLEGTELQRYRASELLANSATFAPDGLHVLVSTAEGFNFAPGGVEFEEDLSGKARVFACDVCASFDELIALAESRVTRELTPEERATYLGQA